MVSGAHAYPICHREGRSPLVVSLSNHVGSIQVGGGIVRYGRYRHFGHRHSPVNETWVRSSGATIRRARFPRSGHFAGMGGVPVNDDGGAGYDADGAVREGIVQRTDRSVAANPVKPASAASHMNGTVTIAEAGPYPHASN